MVYSVFFKEGKEIFVPPDFIDQQPTELQDALQTIVDELSKTGRAAHPSATRLKDAEWSVLLTDNGSAYVYTLFISSLGQQHSGTAVNNTPDKKRTLVIIDPAGPVDSVGGYHPAYWSIEHYASMLEDERQMLFMNTVDQINGGIRSDNYHINADGSISIHIDKRGGAYNILITCRAEWR